MKTKLPIAILIALLALVLMSVPVLAQIATPDTYVTKGVEVYCHVRELNDQLYLIVYELDYTGANPTEDADEAWMCRLMSGDTELGNTVPHPYQDDGYSYGIMSIYFCADDAPTWQGSYTMRLEGNPTMSWEAGTPPHVVTANFVLWSDEGSVVAAQERLTTRLRVIAWLLENDWGVDMVEDSAGGKKLTTNGEDYFTNSIDDLRVICPDLFYDVMFVPEFVDRPLVEDNYMGGDDAAQSIYSANWTAQLFTASDNYPVSGVELKMNRAGDPSTVAVSIRDVTGGVPSGADLASGTLDGDDFTTGTGNWEEVSFSDTYDLTSGTQYAIVVRATGGDIDNYVGWRYDSTGSYTGGYARFSDDSGVVWGASGDALDFMFAVKGFDVLSMSYRDRLAHRLDGTIFDMSELATDFNMSTMWMRALVWMGIIGLITVAAMRAANTYKIGTFVVFLMVLWGGMLGFMYLEVMAVVAFFSAMACVFVFQRSAPG